MLTINIIPCLSDNYSYVIHDSTTNCVGVVDPSEFNAVNKFISDKYKRIDYILNTHHHHDHIGGNEMLKNKYNSKIVASEIDKESIPNVEIKLKNNDIFRLGNTEFKIISVPGHTIGHICFYAEKEKIIFTGDTLFSLGCGKIFEGTIDQMFNSLNIIKHLPKEINIYCGHEYTKKNLNFCLKYEKNNNFLKTKKRWIDERLSQGMPTLPVKLKEEIDTNIFLRYDKLSVKKSLGMETSSNKEVFKKLRDLKDSF